jgi:hypothetical protein
MWGFSHFQLSGRSNFEKIRRPGLARDEVRFQAPERAELFAHPIVCLIEF